MSEENNQLDVEADLIENTPQENIGMSKPDENGMAKIYRLMPEELLDISFREFISLYKRNPYTQEEHDNNTYVAEKLHKYVGENFQDDDIDMTDVRFQKVAKEYLVEKLNKLKTQVLTTKVENLNSAYQELLQFVGLPVDIAKTKKDTIDTMFKHRAGHLPDLWHTYQVIDAVRDIHDISTDSSIALSAENRIREQIKIMDNLHHTHFLSDEQMAAMYENVARIYDNNFSKDKSSHEAVRRERSTAVRYFTKALALTSDIYRIESCTDSLKSNNKLESHIIDLACAAYERYFADNPSENIPATAHENYADAITAKYTGVGFIAGDSLKQMQQQTDIAMHHYYQAIIQSPTQENKVFLLGKLLEKLDKYRYDEHNEYFWKSVNMVGTVFAGKDRITNLIKFLPQVNNKNMRKILLEATFNELVDTTEMNADLRKLHLNNIGHKWLKIADPQTDEYGIKFVKKTLADLQEEENIRLQKEKMPITRLSSKNHDYFSGRK